MVSLGRWIIVEEERAGEKSSVGDGRTDVKKSRMVKMGIRPRTPRKE